MKYRFLIHSIEDDSIEGTNNQGYAEEIIQEIQDSSSTTLEVIDVEKGIRYFDSPYRIEEISPISPANPTEQE